MKLAIIAAGESSRMRAEGIVAPKPLIRINGVPMIERIIVSALANGITEVCCIVNERFVDLREFLSTRKFGPNVEFSLVCRSTPSSMHSLFALAPLLKQGPFCLATADTVFRDDEFEGFLAYAKTTGNADGILAVTRFIDDERPLCVGVDEDMNITCFSDTRDGFEWATGGIYYFSPRIFDVMEYALQSGTMRLRNFLRLLLDCGYRLRAYPFSKMIDVDHISDITAAEQLLAEPRDHDLSAEHDP